MKRRFSFRTKRGPTQQQGRQLEEFLRRLDRGVVTTGELIATLLTIREYSPPRILREWCDGAAHRTRDRGSLFESGFALWAERLQIDKFFDTPKPSYTKIPSRVFEMLLHALREKDFGTGGLGLTYLYPNGYSLDEIVRELEFHYHLNQSNDSYELISTPMDPADLNLVRNVLPLVRNTLWGSTPMHFDEIHEALNATIERLIGHGRRVLKTRKELITLHFLCAFHQTEIKTAVAHVHPCYLTVDAAASGNLTLSLGIYEQTPRGWEPMELSYERYTDPAMTASHDFARPYLVTDLHQNFHLDPTRIHDGNWGIQTNSPLKVVRRRGKHFISTSDCD
jgi:hypothetical protein